MEAFIGSFLVSCGVYQLEMWFKNGCLVLSSFGNGLYSILVPITGLLSGPCFVPFISPIKKRTPLASTVRPRYHHWFSLFSNGMRYLLKLGCAMIYNFMLIQSDLHEIFACFVA